jgi:hypothetical protein
MLNALPQVEIVCTACEAVVGRTDVLVSCLCATSQPLSMSLHTMVPSGCWASVVVGSSCPWLNQRWGRITFTLSGTVKD